MRKVLVHLFLCCVLIVAFADKVVAVNPIIIIEVNNGDDISGQIVVELFPDDAPITVANCLAYIDDGFYDGLIFHRVIEDFMIQGGGFNESLEYQSPTYDPIVNESFNDLSNIRGTIAMARTSEPNSATSQFFINHVDNLFLDRANAQDGVGYCVFGMVLNGMDIVDAIAQTDTGQAYSPTHGTMQDVPQPVVTITSIQRAAVADLTITKCVVKRGKTACCDSLSVTTSVSTTPTEDQADWADNLVLCFGPWVCKIGVNDNDDGGWKNNATSSSYKGTIDGSSVKFTVNFKKNTFAFQAKNIDLTGLDDPNEVEVLIGSYYARATIDLATCKGYNAAFLSGAKDYLSVDSAKTKLKLNTKKDNADSLTIQGSIALADGIAGLDDSGQIDIGWGSYLESIPDGLLVAKSNGKYQYKKPKTSTGTISSAIFDLNKGTFKIMIKKADLSGQPNPAEFSLSFDGFSQTDSVAY